MSPEPSGNQAGNGTANIASRLRPFVDQVSRSPDRVILAVIVVAAAIIRFHALGEKSIWVDEGVSIELARLGWYDFIRIVWRHEGNMLLYHLLLRPWLWFGDSAAYIRSLSVFSTLATLPAVYVLGRRLFDSRTGLIAAFLLSVNAYHVRYAQEARSYVLYLLLCVLSSIYFLKCLDDNSRENRLGHLVTSALAIYAHFFSGLLVIAQWLSLRLLDRPALEQQMKENWRKLAIAVSP